MTSLVISVQLYNYGMVYIYFNFVQEPTSLRQPGEITGRTVLNVFGPMGHGGRWILDSLKVNFTGSKVLLTPKIIL